MIFSSFSFPNRRFADEDSQFLTGMIFAIGIKIPGVSGSAGTGYGLLRSIGKTSRAVPACPVLDVDIFSFPCPPIFPYLEPSMIAGSTRDKKHGKSFTR